MNPSRLWLGSGLGFGFGAFFASFLPLSLLPMARSVPQKGTKGKGQKEAGEGISRLARISRGGGKDHDNASLQADFKVQMARLACY